MADLKPCPFCAENATVYSGRVRGVPWFQVGCPFCHIKTLKRPTLAQASSEWNRRAPQPEPTEAEVEAAVRAACDVDDTGKCCFPACECHGYPMEARAALRAFVAKRNGGGS